MTTLGKVAAAKGVGEIKTTRRQTIGEIEINGTAGIQMIDGHGDAILSECMAPAPVVMEYDNCGG
jgi:hypothetical protein